MEAAGAVDAKNAPTAPWKTRRRVSHSYHRHSHQEPGEPTVSPMFPVNSVTDVPGCTRYTRRISPLWRYRLQLAW